MNKLAMSIIAVTALGAGLFFGVQQRSVDLSDLSGFSFPQPESLQGIDLINHNNEALTEETFKDQWTFVYVGYTFCPDACPMTLNILNQLNTLIDKNDKAKVATLLVSVDPERDTPEHLKNYVEYFNEGFTGATGTPTAIREFADQVSAVYVLPDDRSDPNYLVDHSSSIILINPNAEVQAIFTPPQEAPTLAKDFELLVAHFKSR